MTAAAPALGDKSIALSLPQSTAIAFEKLTVSYTLPDSSTKTILDEIDVSIGEGEFVCVLGETGCGKSTLLRLVLGEQNPTSGKVIVAGQTVERIGPLCGYVPQKYSLFPDRTVLDNITFGPECGYNFLTRLTPNFFSARESWRDSARQHLLRMGLQPGDASKYPHQLSGGMQQRVAIAQALMMEPPILLMDEAFSALDPATRSGMQSLLRSIWSEQKTTVLFVTHNTAEALTLATRVIVLAKSQDRGAKVSLDMQVPSSQEPIAERRHRREFLELIEYVEAHSTTAEKRKAEELLES